MHHKGGVVEQHPVTGEAAPYKRRGRARLFSDWRLEKENCEIHKSVSKKEIKQIPHAVWQPLGDNLPVVLAVNVAKFFLGEKNRGQKHNEDTHVQSPKEIFRRDTATEESADVNPKTENEPSEREHSAESEKGSLPSRERTRVELVSGNCRRATVKKSFDGGFRQG